MTYLNSPTPNEREKDKYWSSRKARNKAILAILLSKDKTIKEIMAQTGVSKRTIKRYIRILQPVTNSRQWKALRNDLIVKKHAKGDSVAELAWVFKVSTREIYRILKNPTTFIPGKDDLEEIPTPKQSKIKAILKKHPEAIGFLYLGRVQGIASNAMGLDLTMVDNNILESFFNVFSPGKHNAIPDKKI